MSRCGSRMRPAPRGLRPHRRGGAWAAGLGVLGLLVSVAIILILFKSQTEVMTSPSGGFRALDEANKLMGDINKHNAGVDKAIAQQGAPTTAPAPTPAPSGGTPSGGETLGPITPVSPVAPLQEGPGANYRSTTNPVNNMNDGMQKRNEELERALRGG